VVCESRPTWRAAELTTVTTLPGGTRLLVRPVLYSDRAELVDGFEHLSPESRRLRFFEAPEHLSGADVEYLTNVDYRDHVALGAFALDEEGAPGVGVARSIRLPGQPTLAEAAVTVVDDHQGRGVGTALLTRLAELATERGIRTFVTYVLWENAPTVEALEEVGARIAAEEPGVARVEIDLPGAGSEETGSRLHRALRAVAAGRYVQGARSAGGEQRWHAPRSRRASR
jgi:GNAT superfamily N-acetyltransferase